MGKHWKGMNYGVDPFGPTKDETLEETEKRMKKNLAHRRQQGLTFMDWLFMPQLQYMMHDKSATCRMMEFWWYKFPEPTYITVTKVEYCELDGRYQARAWGKLHWRGTDYPEEREIWHLT